jgi:hypothetical protein
MKQSFIGCDASLEISLLEYGLIVSENEHEDGSGTHFCVYKISDNSFGTGHMSEKEVNGYIEGKEFMNSDDIKSFLNWNGMTKEDWLKMEMHSKLGDLLQYWGSENIFGAEYSPMTEKEVTKRYLR